MKICINELGQNCGGIQSTFVSVSGRLVVGGGVGGGGGGGGGGGIQKA